MPDFRIADTAPEHPKLRAAGLAAAGLWATAGAYAMRELTDGWVPEYWVLSWPTGKTHAAKLVTVGLWKRETRNGIAGYRFHDWADYQRPAQKFAEEREMARERARRYRQRTQKVTRDVTSDERETNANVTIAPSPSPSPLPQRGDLGGESSGTERVATRNDPPAPNLDPNNPRCGRHAHLPAGDPGPDCRACRDVRLQVEAADEVDPRDAARAAFRAAVDACDLCDHTGHVETDDGAPRRCSVDDGHRSILAEAS